MKRFVDCLLTALFVSVFYFFVTHLKNIEYIRQIGTLTPVILGVVFFIVMVKVTTRTFDQGD